MFRRVILGVLAFGVIMLTGCWDKIEIENRAFVQVITLDKIPEEERTDENSRYLVSFVFPRTAALVGQGGESGGSGGDASITISTTGRTLTQCAYLLSSRLERTLYFNQARIMLFGRELMEDRQLVRETVDKLARDHELNRRMYVGVVDGLARDVLTIKPKVDRLIVGYLTRLFENEMGSSRIRIMEARKFLSAMREGGDLIMPKITPYKDEVKIAGGAVIKDHKFLTWLGEEESIISTLLEGEFKKDSLSVLYKGVPVSYNAFHAERKIKYEGIENGRLKFTIGVDIEGDLEEVILGTELFDSKVIAQIEGLINKEIEKRCRDILDKYQCQYKMDGIRLNEFLYKYHPKVWKGVEDDWEQVYCDALITVESDAKVRRIGMIK
ncbi:MAG: Ger(x)C family spore germination protein [Mahellales bacterium]